MNVHRGFQKDKTGDRETKREETKDGDGDDRRWRDERILEIAPCPPPPGTQGALRGGRKWLVAETE